MINLAVVVTTIQDPTAAMREWRAACDYFNAPLIVVGDTQGPDEYAIADEYWTPGLVDVMDYRLAVHGLPDRCYQRKNIGYLRAMELGAMSIYETDDDNAPLEHWVPRMPFVRTGRIRGNFWVNPYACFTDDYIWPRGYPLELLSGEGMMPIVEKGAQGYAPIQQGLANGSPDVDAVWRLTVGNEPFTFSLSQRESWETSPGYFAPFNSQSTWWWPEAFSMMYLPVLTNWRSSDIIRGLVAQRCLWERDRGIVFHPPEVFQERNEHDLMVDFVQEQHIYQNVLRASEVLRNVELTNYVSHRSNIVDCYRALVDAEILGPGELGYLHAWLQDVKRIMDKREEQ